MGVEKMLPMPRVNNIKLKSVVDSEGSSSVNERDMSSAPRMRVMWNAYLQLGSQTRTTCWTSILRCYRRPRRMRVFLQASMRRGPIRGRSPDRQ